MILKEIDNFLQDKLNIREFQNRDSSMNGVQSGDFSQDITCCAVAVDVSLESINRAADAGAQMLLVHHGLFWGRPIAITGSHKQRIQALIENEIALYAIHLPLDAHNLFGNNINIANQLKLTNISPFGYYKGKQIGYKGKFNTAKSLEEIINLLGTKKERCLKVLPFGKNKIESVGIISGGAPHELNEAIDLGLDLYITGDASHETYHLCQESNINMLSCGHYFSETQGVKSLAHLLHDELKLKTIFIDLPTGL